MTAFLDEHLENLQLRGRLPLIRSALQSVIDEDVVVADRCCEPGLLDIHAQLAATHGHLLPSEAELRRFVRRELRGNCS